jgi:hypothetical protein
MGGYYQSTVMLMRDILETTFLLDFFHKIAVWRACDEKKRNLMALGSGLPPAHADTFKFESKTRLYSY